MMGALWSSSGPVTTISEKNEDICYQVVTNTQVYPLEGIRVQQNSNHIL
jgi:hypothetical protein